MKKLIYSSAVSASVSIVVITVVTIWAEMAPNFKNILAGITGHHWITKSYLTVVLFVAVLGLTMVFSRGEISDGMARKSLWALIICSVLGSIAIFGFFLWHFFN